MKFKNVIQDLALGGLHSTPLVETGSLKINSLFLPKVIQALNRSLEHFYSSYELKVDTILIQLIDGISDYYLDSQYSYANYGTTGVKYILDNDLKPFHDDVIQILAVGTLYGESLEIDDIHSPTGILLPEYNCIRVPYDLYTRLGNEKITELSVTYQATHQRIPLDEPENSHFNINIPIPFYDAFLSYVTYLVLRNMGGNKANDSNSYYESYLNQTTVLKSQGIGVKSQSGINIKPQLKGYF